ncbi:MAG: hypothetical protein M3173_02480 [Chloroflexota bacterium]|nr:hypothetical protein [Chloroflexota bacterium]
MISILLLSMLIIATWLRVARPGGLRVPGRVIHDTPLPLLARLRMHALPGGITIAAAVAMWVFWNLPLWGVLVAAASTALLVAAPVRYTLTPIGIRVGWTPFRRWTEFAGVTRAPGGARLQGAAGTRGLHIWLSGSRGDDEFILLLRRMITGAYKGRNRVLEMPARSQGKSPALKAASVDTSREMF